MIYDRAKFSKENLPKTTQQKTKNAYFYICLNRFFSPDTLQMISVFLNLHYSNNLFLLPNNPSFTGTGMD